MTGRRRDSRQSDGVCDSSPLSLEEVKSRKHPAKTCASYSGVQIVIICELEEQTRLFTTD